MCECDIFFACFILFEYIRSNASCTDYMYRLLHIFYAVQIVLGKQHCIDSFNASHCIFLVCVCGQWYVFQCNVQLIFILIYACSVFTVGFYLGVECGFCVFFKCLSCIIDTPMGRLYRFAIFVYILNMDRSGQVGAKFSVLSALLFHGIYSQHMNHLVSVY